MGVAECSSQECAAEVGAMLGVEFMVNGAIGKLGDAYTIDIKMFSVATGAAENMQSVTYEGKVEGMIVEIEILAWTILGLDAPKDLIKKRRKYAGGDMADSGGGGGISISLPLLGGLGLAAAAAFVLSQPEAASALPEPPALPE